MPHPAVVSCIPGAQSPAQQRQNDAWFAQPNPDTLWTALAGHGLIDPRAPVPHACRS
jgi:D-threo-aldose 1-dehydrogenase